VVALERARVRIEDGMVGGEVDEEALRVRREDAEESMDDIVLTSLTMPPTRHILGTGGYHWSSSPISNVH
jgi:hypothetical protein